MTARLWAELVGDAPDDAERADDGRVILTLADVLELPTRSGRARRVVDLTTGRVWRVRRAACGLGCFCSASAELDA